MKKEVFGFWFLVFCSWSQIFIFGSSFVVVVLICEICGICGFALRNPKKLSSSYPQISQMKTTTATNR
jgi:hypothetical protein